MFVYLSVSCHTLCVSLAGDCLHVARQEIVHILKIQLSNVLHNLQT